MLSIKRIKSSEITKHIGDCQFDLVFITLSAYKMGWWASSDVAIMWKHTNRIRMGLQKSTRMLLVKIRRASLSVRYKIEKGLRAV